MFNIEDSKSSKKVLDSIPYPFYVLDANDYSIKFANSSTSGKIDWQNKTCFQLTHKRESPCSGSNHKCPLEIIKQTKKPTIVEHIHIDESGVEKHFEIHASPVFDKKGNVSQIIEFSVDISERKKIEKELRKNEEKFRNLFNHSNESIIVADPLNEGGPIIVDANKAAWETHGYTKEEFIGLPISSLETHEAQKDMALRKERLLSGESVTFEIEHIRKDGSIIPVEASAKVIITEGKPLVYSIERDLTDIKRAEEELLRERDNAKKYLEIAGTIFVALNTEGEVTLINQKGCEILGYKEEEIIGKNWFENFIPEWLRDELIPISKKLLNGEIETAEYYENPILTRNGEERLIAWHNTIIENEHGDIIGHLSSGEDITERKEAEDAIKNSEEKFRTLADESPNMIFINKNGKVVYTNKKSEELMGYSKDDFYSPDFNILVLIAPEDKDLVMENLGKQLKGEMIPPHEYTLVTKEGKKIHGLHSTKIINYEGALSILGIITDITYRKQSEENLKVFAKELEESNKMKDLFSDIMRHDILNPIGIIMASAELLKEDHPELHELKIISQNCEKTIEIVENASMLSLLENTQELKTKDINLSQVLGDAAYSLKPLFESAGIEVMNNIDGPLEIKANTMIDHVFINLLTNAIKYAPNGKKVIIEGEENHENVIIKVKDFGSGIPEDQKKLIFARFRRVYKGAIKGTGLGLAIVEKLVELHKGSVHAEDNPEGGTVFVVELPKK